MSFTIRKVFRNFPVAKTLGSKCKGPGFNPSSGKWIPHASTKDPACCKHKISRATTKTWRSQKKKREGGEMSLESILTSRQ